jgi:hypothetical protein
MLCRDFMPRTNDAALEQAKSELDSVRNVAVNVADPNKKSHSGSQFCVVS